MGWADPEWGSLLSCPASMACLKKEALPPGTYAILGNALQTQNFRIILNITKIKMTMLLGRYLVFFLISANNFFHATYILLTDFFYAENEKKKGEKFFFLIWKL